ncbi:hypothetical protein ISF_06458 [Cordyceps fumosorosea ARSEF 2679]|uniref:DUF7735 domain-containing protein n=1 Tax=Cordyceps fumosorosea (strain ARSEF 2679) TaxID=1081104 RepID=A0A167RK80_CORFA|nr:hypothetical protein ISF_06458 [Cordyceps fumosorosea ARSEF 2679]OAA58675.1 hypothetical protein ISF_06458 [Cordyceps fumosorosea ARSEF 2679]
MQSKIVLASLVAGAAANNLLTLRQAADPLGSLSKECQADLQEVQSASDLPAIPTAFISDAFAQAQTLSDPCAYTPTGSVAAEYTSFVSAAESWASAHTSIASKIEKDCNAALQNIANLCPSGMGKSVSDGGDATGTAGGTGGSGASATATSSGDAAPATAKPGAAAANGPTALGALMMAALGAIALL